LSSHGSQDGVKKGGSTSIANIPADMGSIESRNKQKYFFKPKNVICNVHPGEKPQNTMEDIDISMTERA
jgi:hypothetical protein